MQNNYKPETWVSHSSISEFLKCPKAYYFRSVYKNPQTKQRISIINPPMALGKSVHDVLESLAILNAENRLTESLLVRFEKVWGGVTGIKGGFKSKEEEDQYKERGRAMLRRVMDNPGPIINKSVRLIIPDPSFQLPHFQLSAEENIILDGKIDWMEYVPETDSVHIIDFKTGKKEEDISSLQLAIYCLLVKNLQNRKIHKVSYWYLDSDNEPRKITIPDLDEAKTKILEIALKIKSARARQEFECPRNGCYACKPYVEIINGNAKFVGTNDYQDIYVL